MRGCALVVLSFNKHLLKLGSCRAEGDGLSGALSCQVQVRRLNPFREVCELLLATLPSAEPGEKKNAKSESQAKAAVGVPGLNALATPYDILKSQFMSDRRLEEFRKSACLRIAFVCFCRLLSEPHENGRLEA